MSFRKLWEALFPLTPATPAVPCQPAILSGHWWSKDDLLKAIQCGKKEDGASEIGLVAIF